VVITLVQMNSVIGDFMGNARHLADLARRTCAGIQNAFNGPDNSTGLGSNPKADKAKGLPDLLVFPELCLCGYPPMDLLDQNAFVAGNFSCIAISAKGIAIRSACCGGVRGQEPLGFRPCARQCHVRYFWWESSIYPAQNLASYLRRL